MWQSMVQFCNQLEAMQNIKEQLEQRTRMIEANIQRQQDELRQIQEELQRVQGQSLQVRSLLRNVRKTHGTIRNTRQVRCSFAYFCRFLCLKPDRAVANNTTILSRDYFSNS